MTTERTNGDLRAGAHFFKGHGLGNDYLVFEGVEAGGEADGFDPGWAVTPEAIRRVCQRHRGVGGDGIVVRLPEVEGGPRLRMFNPDGGEFERSGNGLRVFAAYLGERGEAPTGPFPVRTGGGPVTMEVAPPQGRGVYDVAVSMGQAATTPESVGAIADASLKGPLGEPLDWQPVSVGNPHCVVFGQEVADERARELGPHLERHPTFPHGVNVQLAEVLDAGSRTVRMAIWERGVGITSASGTSACAVATACVERGAVAPGEVVVKMPGGELRVEVDASRFLTLRGPVQEVQHGVLTDGYLTWLGALERPDTTF